MTDGNRKYASGKSIPLFPSSREETPEICVSEVCEKMKVRGQDCHIAVLSGLYMFNQRLPRFVVCTSAVAGGHPFFSPFSPPAYGRRKMSATCNLVACENNSSLAYSGNSIGNSAPVSSSPSPGTLSTWDVLFSLSL